MSDQIKTSEQVMRDALASGVGILLAGKRLPPAEFYRDAVKEAEQVKAAAEQFRNDPRFRALVDSTVSEAFHQHGRLNPDTVERDAHDIATWASALLLARIYEQDAELRAMREERDSYKALAEHGLKLTPPPRWVIDTKLP